MFRTLTQSRIETQKMRIEHINGVWSAEIAEDYLKKFDDLTETINDMTVQIADFGTNVFARV